MLLFPLTFISTAFMPAALIPGWMQTAADFNPVNWAVEAARIAASGDDWGKLAIYVAACSRSCASASRRARSGPTSARCS